MMYVFGKALVKNDVNKYVPFIFYKYSWHYTIVETESSPWPVSVYRGFEGLFNPNKVRIFHDVTETD